LPKDFGRTSSDPIVNNIETPTDLKGIDRVVEGLKKELQGTKRALEFDARAKTDGFRTILDLSPGLPIRN